MERSGRRDQVVRGQHRDRPGPVFGNLPDAVVDRRQGVSAHRLHEDPAVASYGGELVPDQEPVLRVRDDGDILRRGEEERPPHGLLKEGLVVDQRDELFRVVFP
jgi:hypothetical protein